MKNSFEGGQEAVPQQKLLQRLKAEAPDENVAFTAISQLKNPEEMKQFFQEYVELLKSDPELTDPESVARQNIGYFVDYYDQETADAWRQALLDVSHPVFGREIPSTPDKSALEAGKDAARQKISDTLDQ